MEISHTRQLEVLVQVAQMVSTLDLDEVLLQTLTLTTEATNATKGSFFLLDEQGRALQRFIAARDMDMEKKAMVSHIVLEEGVAGWVLANKQAATINDTTQDSRWVPLDDLFRVRSALCVPFFVKDQVRGVMTLEHPEPFHFTPDDVRLATAVANQASSALQNAQLFDRVQAQERQLAAVLDSVTEALLVVDHDWRIRGLNPAVEQLLGLDAEAVRDRYLNDATQNPLFLSLIEKISELKLSEGTKTFELRDEAGRRDFAVNVTPLVHADPAAMQYVIVLYDVTSLKDLNRLKTHMIRMASHDLKNPLGLLSGYLDLVWTDIQNKTIPDPMYVESLYKAVTRMETLIASLLNTQRAESNTTMDWAPIDPNELIQAALDDMLPLAEQHKHTVVKDIQTMLHPLKGDFVQLREAIDNLISNAIKYTPDGGKITIHVYIEEDRFYFSVEDTGYGIPADQQDQIFEPYFRAKQEATAHIEGTGVGLNLVKETIEQHGGHTWFTSEQGVGSTFGFWLPMLDSPA